MTTAMQELLDEIRAQAVELELARFDHETARRIGEGAAREMLDRSLPATVRVVRGEQVVFHASFAGTTPEHDGWLQRKINTTLRHDIPSLELVVRHELSGRAPDWLDPQRYAIAGGAVPLRLDGNVVGVIAVSGLLDSISADHELAMRAIRHVRAADGTVR